MDNLQSGIAAFKSGKREDARKYLIAAVKENPKDENAWGWLYQVANNDNERIECLKKVTAINPNNEKAIQLLNKLLAPPLTPTPEITNPPQQKQVNLPSSSSKQVNSPSIATRKNNRKTLTYSVAIIASLCLVCLVAALAINTANPSQPTTPTPQANNTSVPIATQTESVTEVAPTAMLEPTNMPLPPTPTQNPNLIKPGTYLVGVDIKPGIYRGEAGEGLFSSCYWARLKDLSGSFDALLANENSIGQFYVEIRDSDYAVETRCELVPLDSLPASTGEFPQIIKAGTYIIGRDIQAGTYKGQAGTDITTSCYWVRLNNVAGDFDSIIANENAVGQFYVQVAGSDFALSTACELERVGD